MATITSTTSGNASTGGTWVGGVAPVLGDKVVIASGHTVTVDNTSIEWGDDTITAVTVTGTLKASRAASSTLRVRGEIVGTGTIDYGTLGDPITGVKAICYLNDSATLVAGKYGIYGSSTTTPLRFYSYGDTRTRHTVSTADCASGQANITVSSVTGWEIGDIITVGSSNTYTEAENKIIQSIAGSVVTCTTNFTYAHTSDVPIVYSGGSVQFRPYNDAYPSFIALRTATTSDAIIEIQNTYFHNINGTCPRLSAYGLSLYQTNTGSGYTSITACSNNSFYINQNPSGNTMLDVFYHYYVIPMTNNSFASSSLVGGAAIYYRNSAVAEMSDSCFINIYTGISSAWNAGITAGTFTNCTFNGCYRAFNMSVGFNVSSLNCTFDANRQINSYTNCAKFNLTNCDINKGVGTPESTDFMASLALNSIIDATLDNCDIEIGGGTSISNYLSSYQTNGNPTSIIRNLNQEGSPLNQEYYYQGVYVFRDNSTFFRGQSSIRMMPKMAGDQTFSIKILTLNGISSKIIGYMRFNSDYGGTTAKPKVTVSGLGIAPITVTMTGSADTWEKYEIDVIQNSGADGELDLIFTGNSDNLTTGACWFDGVPASPFVTSVRHYGYIFQPTIAKRIVDPVTVLTESAANAITGYSINDGTETLTITGTLSVSELYDAIHADRCTNLDEADFFRSTDGANFVCDYDVYFNGGTLTGTGTLDLGSKEATYASGGGTTLIVSDVNGTAVSIALTGLISGSRVQIYDLDNTTELYNDVVAGTILTLPFTYTTDTDIRIRVMYVSGATAKLFYEDTRTITNTGVSVAIAQIDDTVYINNGVDGSTISTVAIDDTNLLISVDTGTISWADIYAYETYWLGTLAGIRDEGRFISATDSANYILTDFKIKNVTSPTEPLEITGGWGRDSVTGKSVTLIDTTGGTIFNAPDHVVSYAVSSGGGATAAEVWSYGTRKLSSAGITEIQTGLATTTDVNNAKPSLLVGGKIIL